MSLFSQRQVRASVFLAMGPDEREIMVAMMMVMVVRAEQACGLW